jgi:hypothetical protein
MRTFGEPADDDDLFHARTQSYNITCISARSSLGQLEPEKWRPTPSDKAANLWVAFLDFFCCKMTLDGPNEFTRARFRPAATCMETIIASRRLDTNKVMSFLRSALSLKKSEDWHHL